MSNDRPPPYQPTAPGPPPVLSSQPGAFPGSSYQTFPQTYAGGGDHAYYQHPGQLGHSGHSGYPGHLGHPGHLIPQPGYHSTPYPPKHTVYIVERQQDHHEDGNSGSDDSCLSALSTALCCCCLFDLLSHHDF